LENDIKQYLRENYIPHTPDDEQFFIDCSEEGIHLRNPRDYYLPDVELIKKGDYGEAIGSYLMNKMYDIYFPVLPWARKESKNTSLKNFDLIGFKLLNDQVDFCLICESKLGLSLNSIQSEISKCKSKYKELNREGLIEKVRLFRRLFRAEFNMNYFNNAMKKHFQDKNSVKLLGIFTGPPDINFNNCSKEFQNTNKYFPCFRHLIKYFDLENSINRLYE